MALLLRHDLKLLLSYKKTMILIAIALPLIIFIFSLVTLSLSMALIAIIMVITNETSGKLLNSLTTARSEIVRARFVFMIIVTLIVIVYLLLIMSFLDNDFNNTLAFINVNVIALALLMPIGFIFSSKSSNAISVAFILFNSFSLFIWDLLLENPLISTIIAIVVLISSFFISISIFNEREFH